MKSAKSICRQVGCPALISSPGYCEQHKKEEGDRFKDLERAPGSREFYGSHKWTKTAKAYRQYSPLCEEHKRRGLVVKGSLVDHKIERPELEALGLNPFDFQFLQTLCTSCHNKKLRERQQKFKRKR